MAWSVVGDDGGRSRALRGVAEHRCVVAAYEAAFAATVPPPVIAANRAQLMVLVATNFFGQNTAAIAATEAQYAEMWAQDATAMYGYAGSSAAASQLTSFSQPAQVAAATAPTTQAAAVTQASATSAGTGQSTLSQLLATLPGALQSLASPASSGSGSSTTGLSGVLNVIFGANGSAFGDFLNSEVLNSIFASGFYMPARYLGTMSGFMGLAGNGADAAAAVPGPAADAVETPLRGVGVLGNSAGLGRASLVGPLSVPPSWATPAPLHNPLSTTLGGAPLGAPSPAVAASTPPVPLANMAGDGEGRAVPQYGFRPRFVARPPAAG
jgi:PPE-repeat protein